jgi:hypothetical protein
LHQTLISTAAGAVIVVVLAIFTLKIILNRELKVRCECCPPARCRRVTQRARRC